MKNAFVVPACLVCAAMGACGGGGSSPSPAPSPSPSPSPSPVSRSITIGGTVKGISADQTVLLTNNGETVAVTSAGNFVFAKMVAQGAAYDVRVRGKPAGVVCSVANGAATVSATAENVSNVGVDCTPGAVALSSFYVGVTVSGLSSGSSVVLNNNQADELRVTENGLFVFSQDYARQAVYAGVTAGYAVTVKTNPAGQACSVAGGAGQLADSARNFVNIAVTCK